ncbi:MAG: hypothetical protein R3D88_00050 [Alphaproteobacteria bacterium]
MNSVNANRQLDHRRRLTETVLAGVVAGVVGVDSQGKITLANSMAGKCLNRSQSLIGKRLKRHSQRNWPLFKKANIKPEKITG